MACDFPLRAFQIGLTDNGKKDLIIGSTACENNEILLINRRTKTRSYTSKKNFLPQLERYHMIYKDSLLIPCGQCLGCRIDKSREWASRLVCESKYHDSCYFLTLTYSDDNINYSINTGFPTLVKRDIQLFLKRLRKRTGQKLRYYCSGEYGDTTGRPHYHMILFGYDPPLGDLVKWSRSKYGYDYYTSDIINDCWKLGYVILGDLSFQSCAYTAKYTQKKLDGKLADYYSQYDILPPFALMSRRPGLGLDYYNDNVSSIIDDKHLLLENGNIVPVPRYYLNKLAEDYPDEYEQITEARKQMALELADMARFETDLDEYEYRAVRAANRRAKDKRKERPL